jgi:hypothetical protein
MQYQSEQINELITALAKAQGEISAASKDCANPFFKSKYADLNSVWGACREPLSKNGLAVTQTVQQRESGDVLVTLLGHASGQWISSTMSLRIKSDGKTNELQVLGSCLTYLRRFALAAIVGVAPAEDDDGNGGRGYQSTPEPKQPTTPPVEMITPFQVEQLKSELKSCSKEFVDSVDNWMKNNSIASFEALNKMNFLQLLQKAIQDNQKVKNQAKEVAQ